MNRLWYTQPAKDWNGALPLGNGFIGAMCSTGHFAVCHILADGCSVALPAYF